MSRDFNGTTQYAGRADALGVTAYPVTVAGWVRLDALPGTGTWDNMFALVNDPTVSDAFYLAVNDAGNLSSGTVRSSVWSDYFNTSNAISTGAWAHVCTIFTSATSRRSILNGVWASSGVGTNDIGGFPVGLDICELARWVSNDEHINGQMAHWSAWAVALTQAEVEGLAAGDNPLAVQNANLVAYWPFLGTASPEPDEKGSYDLTLYNSPPQGGSDPTVDPPPGSGIAFSWITA